MMLVIYVDDCGIGSANPNDIDKLVEDLRKLGIELTREGMDQIWTAQNLVGVGHQGEFRRKVVGFV